MNEKDTARFLSKFEQAAPNECWPWSAGKNTAGYGMMNIGGRMFYAHRLSYEHFTGSIPEGRHIDHTCANKGCVSPHHLQCVTVQQNVQLGHDRRGCRRGHPWTEENTLRWGRHRRCKTCYDEWVRARRLRNATDVRPTPSALCSHEHNTETPHTT